jgi:AraC-like DNA-binding protein
VSYREGVTPDGRIFENHCHPSYELIAVLSGSVNLALENVKYSLTSGEIAIIPPLAYHSIFCERDAEYERITALFDKSFIPEEIYGELSERSEVTLICSHSSLTSSLASMKEIFFEESSEKYGPLLSSLLTEVLYIYTFKGGNVLSGSAHPTVRAVISYVDEHIGEKILLDDIAAAAFVSKSTVSHIFLSEMKISVKQYILHKKLSYAAHLISEGKRATEAARLVGYENYANFYKVYRKIFGRAPKEKV